MKCKWLNYLEIIRESKGELFAFEKKHRASHYGQRFRMIQLLKSGCRKSVQQVADTLGYSLRQCQRWLKLYRQKGLDGLRSGQLVKRGGSERITEAAWEAPNGHSPVMSSASWTKGTFRVCPQLRPSVGFAS